MPAPNHCSRYRIVLCLISTFDSSATASLLGGGHIENTHRPLLLVVNVPHRVYARDGRRCDRLRLGHARLGLLGRLHEAEDAVVPGGVLCGHHGLRLDAGARHDLNGRLGERSVRGLS